MVPRKLLGLLLALAAAACAQQLPSAPSVQGSQASAPQLPSAPSAQASVPQSVVALHYTVKMQRPQGSTTFEAWAGPESAKATIRETDDRGFAPGVVIVVLHDGELRQMGSLARGEYFEFTRTQLEEAAKRRVAAFNFGPFQTKETLNQPGEKVLGLATTHHQYELTSTFTQEGAQHSYRATQDIWITHDVALPNPKLELLFSQGATGIPAIDNLSTSDAGFPVRRLTSFEIDGQKMGSSSFELLSVEKTRVDARSVALPAGMKQVQQPTAP